MVEISQNDNSIQQLVYKGEWYNDVPHGKGIYYFFQNEWAYEGDFANGMFNGQGVIRFNGKDVFRGTFKNFMMTDFLLEVQTINSSITNQYKLDFPSQTTITDVGQKR